MVVLMVAIGHGDHNAPPLALRVLLGVIGGTLLGCYVVLIGYVNRDAGRRGMSRGLWTLLAIIVPNALGIVLYFILRKPRTGNCPQCDAEVEPGFSFCPRCRHRLQPVWATSSARTAVGHWSWSRRPALRPLLRRISPDRNFTS
jgi:hypothetical protein